MARRELWIVAGPNGAGKTTLVQRGPLHSLLPHVLFLNPDDVALKLLQEAGYQGFHDAASEDLNRAFLQAADHVLSVVVSRLESGDAVGIETVLSSMKYRPLVEYVLQLDGFVGLIYVWLNSSALACERVERRTALGGHSVPKGKIESRWWKSLENLGWFAQHASQFWAFDNSDSHPDTAPTLLARGGHGVTAFLDAGVSASLSSVLPPSCKRS